MRQAAGGALLFATREIRLNNARIYSAAAFDVPPQFCRAKR